MSSGTATLAAIRRPVLRLWSWRRPSASSAPAALMSKYWPPTIPTRSSGKTRCGRSPCAVTVASEPPLAPISSPASVALAGRAVDLAGRSRDELGGLARELLGLRVGKLRVPQLRRDLAEPG